MAPFPEFKLFGIQDCLDCLLVVEAIQIIIVGESRALATAMIPLIWEGLGGVGASHEDLGRRQKWYDTLIDKKVQGGKCSLVRPLWTELSVTALQSCDGFCAFPVLGVTNVNEAPSSPFAFCKVVLQAAAALNVISG
jgi:hypothetical protein